MEKTRAGMVLPFAILLVGCGLGGPPEVSDRKAQGTLESMLPRILAASIPTGRVSVASRLGQANWREGLVSASDYQWIRCAEAAGFVEVEVDEDWKRFKQGETFSWDMFDSAMKGSVTDKISVTLTTLGNDLEEHSEYSDWRTIPLGTVSAVRVLAKEYKGEEAGRYALVLATFDVEWSSLALACDRYGDTQQIAFILKWDPFKKEWLDVNQWRYAPSSTELDLTPIREKFARLAAGG